MTAMSQGQLAMVRAFFCNEFQADSLDRSTVPDPTADAVAEWIDALATSGLFAPAEVRNISSVWASEPETMVALLVGEVDEIAVKRNEVAAPAPAIATPALISAFERAS
ncbi:hypothetical protein CH306_15760 [Rhodococcus sp. 15-725-2-2b]|uniref:hypothetical protein n=1 Tax=Nocardiaceae TaxID=85025 RepID=UPI00068EF5F6|nr:MULTISPECIES: hypothetical protein [Rhodococcus]OZC56090.1 hypothetical protein CH276_27405 [Rhodococcus sp. 06-470-2]OZC65945.1 hypothetical protein CH277_16590 [Rhodococcus sp. 06-469-3-2]OZC74180.1 hypothetical protein CH274_24045 [Rhodococcus sp. 06-418-5]OZD41778.1 hypothetical protein CH264_22730 [Rhodococcus sp. 06-1477-1A]OZD85195.1 hypothetical protein CH273_04775 [Rhodococcus sp. 05-339-2]